MLLVLKLIMIFIYFVVMSFCFAYVICKTVLLFLILFLLLLCIGFYFDLFLLPFLCKINFPELLEGRNELLFGSLCKIIKTYSSWDPWLCLHYHSSHPPHFSSPLFLSCCPVVLVPIWSLFPVDSLQLKALWHKEVVRLVVSL